MSGVSHLCQEDRSSDRSEGKAEADHEASANEHSDVVCRRLEDDPHHHDYDKLIVSVETTLLTQRAEDDTVASPKSVRDIRSQWQTRKASNVLDGIEQAEKPPLRIVEVELPCVE